MKVSILLEYKHIGIRNAMIILTKYLKNGIIS